MKGMFCSLHPFPLKKREASVCPRLRANQGELDQVSPGTKGPCPGLPTPPECSGFTRSLPFTPQPLPLWTHGALSVTSPPESPGPHPLFPPHPLASVLTASSQRLLRLQLANSYTCSVTLGLQALTSPDHSP
ncbi:unnamed protein product [Pipistrellus nathusii]|uniref:Uncharacterized protein n=1 Tax=Pipistrellus nathusii TaxID=59473 RepID=A0ABP0AH48_PIPNA